MTVKIIFTVILLLLFFGALGFLIKGTNKIAPIIVMAVQIIALILLWVL